LQAPHAPEQGAGAAKEATAGWRRASILSRARLYGNGVLFFNPFLW
jgi:hypothetical protein